VSRKSGRVVTKLGAPNPTVGGAASAAKRRAQADEFAGKMLPIIADIQNRGVVKLAEIASELTRQKWKTASGAETWSMMAVSRILKRQH
jgi:hypothetical protein